MPADTAAAGADGARGDFPRAFYAVIRWIDSFSDITGKLIALSMLFLVASITYEVVARYFFHAPTIWVYEASYMVNGAAFMLGCGYALLLTVIFWPVNAIVRRRFGARLDLAPASMKAYKMSKVGALLIVLALLAWAVCVTKMFGDLNNTTSAFDAITRRHAAAR